MLDETRLSQCARAHRAGDLNALRPLVEALTGSLIAMAYRYVGDWEVARDLTQDTWVHVHRSIERWDPSRPVRPWVLAIHRNLCLDHLRRAQHPVRDERLLAEIQDTGEDPLQAVARRELVSRIREALTQLSELQRRIFLLVDLEELKPGEVAADMGMNPATVRTTLYFARRKLARLLGKEEA